MMKRVVCFLTLVAAMVVGPVHSGEIAKITRPQEVRAEIRSSDRVPKELEGLQWNRWTTKNFVVCSLNDTQAQYLHKHLELVKGWVFARWGMYDIDFSLNTDGTPKCKIICVDDPVLFKKFFNIDSSRVEIRREANGSIRETVIFLLINDSPSKILPTPLTEICLAEFAQKYNAKFGTWAYRGMATLNGSIDQIKERMAEIKPLLEKNEPLFFSKGVMEMDADQYEKLDVGKKRLYDNCSMLFCLLARKEYGQDAFLKLLKESADQGPQPALKSLFKSGDYDLFDRTFKRYMIDLTRDLETGKTPDSYLQIKEK
jgi:hypothetical protein